MHVIALHRLEAAGSEDGGPGRGGGAVDAHGWEVRVVRGERREEAFAGDGVDAVALVGADEVGGGVVGVGGRVRGGGGGGCGVGGGGVRRRFADGDEGEALLVVGGDDGADLWEGDFEGFHGFGLELGWGVSGGGRGGLLSCRVEC